MCHYSWEKPYRVVCVLLSMDSHRGWVECYFFTDSMWRLLNSLSLFLPGFLPQLELTLICAPWGLCVCLGPWSWCLEFQVSLAKTARPHIILPPSSKLSIGPFEHFGRECWEPCDTKHILHHWTAPLPMRGLLLTSRKKKWAGVTFCCCDKRHCHQTAYGSLFSLTVPEGSSPSWWGSIAARGRGSKSKDHISKTHGKQREKTGNEPGYALKFSNLTKRCCKLGTRNSNTSVHREHFWFKPWGHFQFILSKWPCYFFLACVSTS